MNCMNMPGMGWMMGVGMLLWVLVFALAILGIAALIKYLRSDRLHRTP